MVLMVRHVLDTVDGVCSFLSTESNSNNGADKNCYCGLSHEEAKQNNIPCNYHLLNEANDISLQIEINLQMSNINKYNLLNNN